MTLDAMILYSEEPLYIGSIYRLIVVLHWICSVYVRESIIEFILLIIIHLRVPHFSI
jgi:hypothetical protein